MSEPQEEAKGKLACTGWVCKEGGAEQSPRSLGAKLKRTDFTLKTLRELKSLKDGDSNGFIFELMQAAVWKESWPEPWITT